MSNPNFAKNTDGFFAKHFDRKISGAISQELLKTPVTPNQITVFVTCLGIVAGWFMAQRGYAAKVEGSLLFLLTSILDGCDGEVARAKNMKSRLGGWLDLWGDNVVHVAVFYGLGVGLLRDTENAIYLKLGWAAVWGTLISATLASYQMRRKGQSSFTSVSGESVSGADVPAWRKQLIQISDALARRDFVYGVVLLALINHLSWFLWACAFGSIAYAIVLGVLLPFHTPIGIATLISLRAIYYKVLGKPAPEEKSLMKIIRILGVLIGIGIVTFLIHEAGWKPIKHSLGMLGWGYAIVIVYPISWILLNTAGWRMALHAQYGKLSIGRLAQIRLSGETFNSLLPSGYVGGEPLKAKLLSRWIPIHEAASSVLIAKAAQSIGLVIFVGLGLTLGGHKGQRTLQHHPKTIVALILLTIGIFIFTVLLTRRSFSRLGKWLHNLTGHPWLQKQEDKLLALDDSIGAFYREGKGRFLGSVLWHGAGWIAGALEVAVIFMMIGHKINLREAWFIGAMAQLASVLGLFAPAGVGMYEGGHYLAASILGISPVLGVSVALIRRVREIFWDLVGLFLFWKLSKEEKA